MLRYLLLDLDNTLYSESYGLEKEVFLRMSHLASRLLGLSLEETITLRRTAGSRFGTTLEWLMTDYGYTDVEEFFALVHPEGEEARLSEDPALGRILDSIDLPMAIFTNSPREHAERILARLGIAGRFEAIYDIRFNELRGKPHVEACRKVCGASGVEPGEALFVDDLPKYVGGFIEAGGRGLLLDEFDRHGKEAYRRIHGLVELPALIAEEKAEGAQPSLFD